MIRTLPGPTEGIKQFRAAPWPFQSTFLTPMKNLSGFVGALLARFVLEYGGLQTDIVVFEPLNLLELLSTRSIPVNDTWHFILEAEGQVEIAELLEAALGDSVDFIFVPSPGSFAIYADHDEYTTVYASTDSELRNLVSGLQAAGFNCVTHYTRPSGDHWK